VPLGDLTPQLRVRLYRMERFVGLFVAVAAGLMLAGFLYYLYHTAERRGWFVPSAPYFTFVRSAAGIAVGDPILLMGFSVGEITQIEAQPPDSYYNVFVAFDVRRPYYGYLWTDSKVRIASGDLLGGRLLEVTKGVEGRPTVYETDGRVERILVDGKAVPLEDSPKGVFLEPLEEPALTERAEALLGSLETRLPEILDGVEEVLSSADVTLDTVGALAEEARPVVANLREITGHLTTPDGSLGEWLLTPELREGLDTTLSTLNAELEALSEILANVAAMTGSLREQVEGNDHILDEISSLVTETDDLVKGLKRHWLLRGSFETPPPTVPETVDDPQLAPPGEASP
jgi:ABC-type transporter Mla subunit MlaD